MVPHHWQTQKKIFSVRSVVVIILPNATTSFTAYWFCSHLHESWSNLVWYFVLRPKCGITSRFAYQTGLTLTFSASTLLAGRQKEHPACINWLMRCWSGYLSGARCRLFAYGPADATAIPKPHRLLPRLNPDWFYLFGTGLTRLSWKSSRSQTQLLVSEWSVGLWS